MLFPENFLVNMCFLVVLIYDVYAAFPEGLSCFRMILGTSNCYAFVFWHYILRFRIVVTRASAMQHSSRNSPPAPDLVLFRLIVQRVFFSGGVLFAQAPVCLPPPIRHPLNAAPGAQWPAVARAEKSRGPRRGAVGRPGFEKPL